MKIGEVDVRGILKKYNLGRAKKIKVVEGGIVNYNFDVETNKGRFIVRFMHCELDDERRNRFVLKFKVLDCLKGKDFPYKTPVPIRNKDGEHLTKMREKYAWIYEWIGGKSIPRANKTQISEIAKAIATYNKFISKWKWKYEPDDYGWLIGKYLRMKKVSGRKPLDKIMLKNVDFFEKTFLEWKKKPFNKNIIPIHSDLHQGNVLFDGDKVVAILDFGNIKLSPRVRDVAHLIGTFAFDKAKLNRSKMKNLLRIYEEIAPLTKREKAMIIPYIIQYNCIIFWWTYGHMEQAKHKKYSSLKLIIETTKNLVRTREWKEK